VTNSLAEPGPPEAARRPRRGYLSIALVTVLPAALVLVLGPNAPLVMVGAVWLIGTLAVVFAPQFPVGQKAVAIALLPAGAIAWRILNLARGETVCVSASDHPVAVCSGGHPGVNRVIEAMPVLVAVILVVAAVMIMRSRRSHVER
jgi:hypothetical protein